MTLGILLVDPQLDFFPGGALGVAEGEEILGPINRLLKRHPELPVFVSRDWHPASSAHFEERGGRWPPHCVQGSDGARFHPHLERPDGAQVFSKGTDPDNDAGYSAFEAIGENGQPLMEALRREGVTGLIVAGLATDYCVKASVLDARRRGLAVMLFEPGVRAVNLKPEDGHAAMDTMRAAGALFLRD